MCTEKKGECANDILCGINTPKDSAALTDLEKKHQPVITAPEAVARDDVFEITVEVGKLLAHPNEAGHFVEWIELYAGDTFLARSSYSGAASYPTAVFKVKLSHACGPIRVIAKCNLHGTWEGTKDIAVS